MNMSFYRRVCKGVNTPGTLVPVGKEFNAIENFDDDYYLSIFDYDEKHFDRFRSSGTVSGITDVTTTRLVWDFDKKEDPNAARLDAIELVQD